MASGPTHSHYELNQGSFRAKNYRTEVPRRFTEQDWAAHRELISSKYTWDDLSTSTVRSYMQRHHGLLASHHTFNARLQTWGLSKHVRDDEIKVLRRIEKFREIMGHPVEFWKYGKRIQPNQLKCHLRDGTNLEDEISRQYSNELEAAANDIEFLCARGLAVFSPCPSLGLPPRGIQRIVETSTHALKVLGDPEFQWHFHRNPESPWLLHEALLLHGPKATSANQRKSAWDTIHKACEEMEKDVRQKPDDLMLHFLWVLGTEGLIQKLSCLIYQLVSQVASLFEQCCGVRHPYSILFVGAARLVRDQSTFNGFSASISEVLIDTIIKRLHLSGGNTSYSHKFLTFLPQVSPQRRRQFETVLRHASGPTSRAQAGIDHVEILYSLRVLSGEPEVESQLGRETQF